MAIGEITSGLQTGQVPANPTFVDNISFPGDDAYPTGGSPFEALFRTAEGKAITVLTVVTNDCGEYRVAYIPATQTLMVLDADGAEVADGTNLSGTTFNVTVFGH